MTGEPRFIALIEGFIEIGQLSTQYFEIRLIMIWPGWVTGAKKEAIMSDHACRKSQRK